jgi:hypothetical protein
MPDDWHARIGESIRARGERPSHVQYEEMIARGVIDREGNVLIRRPHNPEVIMPTDPKTIQTVIVEMQERGEEANRKVGASVLEPSKLRNWRKIIARGYLVFLVSMAALAVFVQLAVIFGVFVSLKVLAVMIAFIGSIILAAHYAI